MSSYLEHAKQRVKNFEVALKDIKKSDYTSFHIYQLECGDLLNKYRHEFNQLAHQHIFGEISVEEYMKCLDEYTQAQLYMEHHLLLQ